MNGTLQTWLVIVVNATAAVVFYGVGSRMHNLFLMGTGIAFLAACLLLVAGLPPFTFSSASACGYSVGFAASVAGVLGLLKAYVERQKR